MTTKADEYRGKAIACEQRAREATDLPMSQLWDELATHWRYLANQGARLANDSRSPLTEHVRVRLQFEAGGGG
jgi:hypothetical protein